MFLLILAPINRDSTPADRSEAFAYPSFVSPLARGDVKGI